MDVQDRIKSAMREAGIGSAAELARRVRPPGNPVTFRAYVSKGENTRNPPLDVCNQIGKVLGVGGQWLFNGRGPKKPTAALAPPNGMSAITHVPHIDEVTAGMLAKPASQIPMEDVPLLAFADLGPGEWFALTVRGTSMDRISPEGSIILVNKRDRTLVSGRFYVFSVRGETTYKRWQGGDPPYLEPFSTDAVHKPLFPKPRQLEIVGRVKRTVLDL